MQIPSAYRRIIPVASGVHELPLPAGCSHHAIAVEGATGLITLEVKPIGQAQFRPFADNTLEQNGFSVFMLGSVDAVRITPVNTGVAYTISASSF